MFECFTVIKQFADMIHGVIAFVIYYTNDEARFLQVTFHVKTTMLIIRIIKYLNV